MPRSAAGQTVYKSIQASPILGHHSSHVAGRSCFVPPDVAPTSVEGASAIVATAMGSSAQHDLVKIMCRLGVFLGAPLGTLAPRSLSCCKLHMQQMTSVSLGVQSCAGRHRIELFRRKAPNSEWTHTLTPIWLSVCCLPGSDLASFCMSYVRSMPPDCTIL